MPAPSLSTFTADLRDKNISKPHLFYVEIFAPNSTSTETGMVSLWCSGASTPHNVIMTNDNYIEAGIRRKYAYDQDIQNLVLTFYVDQDFQIKKFFDVWKSKVVSNRRSFEYPDSYTAEFINVYIINQSGDDTYKYEYSRAYPKTISSIELTHSGATHSTLSVEFVFEEVYYTSMKTNEFTSKPKDQITDERLLFTNKEFKQEFTQRFEEAKRKYVDPKTYILKSTK